jgi:hypothetical protein
VYCPNCGKKQKSERPIACPKCTLPLAAVAEIIHNNRAAIEERERQARETRNRLIGSGLFVVMAAIPVGLGVKNTLTAEEPPRQLPPKP